MQWNEGKFQTSDGLTLLYRYKKPKNKTKNVLLFLHRGHEHSGRMLPFIDKVSQDDYWCFGFDLRGHGRSEGKRAWAASFETWVKDLNSFVGHIAHDFGLSSKDSILIANSVGSVAAVSWILNYGPSLKGCILGSPAFSIKLYIPFALPLLRFARKFSDDLFVTSYVRSGLLTRDNVEAKLYDSDPLITKKIGVNILVTLFDTVKNCFNRLKDFETPVLLVTAEKDYIVKNKFHSTFINNISSENKKHIVLSGFRHAIFHEKEQEKIVTPCRYFIKTQFQNDGMQLPAVIPEARAHTVIEYQELIKKGSPIEQIYYASYRILLEKIGRFSKGVSIGLEYGFDSGVSLDYVYCNQSSGANWLGRAIDRSYLNSIGWRGIRTRKIHLKSTLVATLKLLNKNNIKPIVLDIASGPGRYLFEAQNEMTFPIQLLLNDIDVHSIDRAKKIAQELKIENASFTNQDAFLISANLAEPDHAPNIIIVSGLFELYESNQQVHQVISHLFKILKKGGYLIYTGQPWHPQIKLISRILNNRNGYRWVMRRRIQYEMDLLVESTGFRKLNTEADEHGIFTVSCAQKL